MNETVHRKAFKTQRFISHKKSYIAQEKVKTFRETVSFHLASNHSKYFNQMYFHIFYISALPAGHFNIAHNALAYYGKIRLRVLANHSARYIFRSSSHIINNHNAQARKQKEN